MLGLRPLRIRDAGNAPGPHAPPARRAVEQARVDRPHPAVQFGRGHEFGAPDPPLAPELHAAIPEDGEEERDQPAAGLQAEPGARQYFPQDLLARIQCRHRTTAMSLIASARTVPSGKRISWPESGS